MRLLGTILLLLAMSAEGGTFTPVPSLAQRLDAIERIRQRSFMEPVLQKTITREELREFVREQFGRDLGLTPDEYLEVLAAAHLISLGGTDFEKLLDLYDSQVLAFYDPETHIYYSLDRPPSGTTVNPLMGETVAIHELTHALQDQQFLLGAAIERRKGDWDAQMAYHAVIEGEATLVMLASMFEMMGKKVDDAVRDESLLGVLTAGAAAESGVAPGVERYFIESMKFPYIDGFRFVLESYKRGGWSAVDDLHRDPPRSTEQILHPELYFEGGRNPEVAEPVRVASHRLRQRPIFEGPLGEFALRFLVGDAAAAGWRGDQVSVYGDGRAKLVILTSEWDTNHDAEEFGLAYLAFLRSKGHRDIEMTCSGRSVEFVYGGSREQRKKLGLSPANQRSGAAR